MKVVILAGGLGSRISGGRDIKPKPMVEIGDKPMLWHIMKYYSSFGFDEFIICLGFMQYAVKEYFANYYLHNSDVEFDLENNCMKVFDNHVEPWKVTLVDTGLNTMTGGRIMRIQKYIGDEPFILTYGDAVSDVDIGKLLKFHMDSGKTVTLTAVKFGQSKGTLEFTDSGRIMAFREKEDQDGEIIDGGFMVMSPKVFDSIYGDSCDFGRDVFPKLAADGELMAYYHDGFWQWVDTHRDVQFLENLWIQDRAPWKRW